MPERDAEPERMRKMTVDLPAKLHGRRLAPHHRVILARLIREHRGPTG